MGFFLVDGMVLGALRAAAFMLVVVPMARVEGQAPPQWRLDPSPEFEVGGWDAPVEGGVSELGGVRLLPDGRVVAGDRMAKRLTLFGADGAFIRHVGREGQGPGEYEYVLEMDRCAPDELHVHDVGGRLHRYTLDLELITTERIAIAALGGGTAYERDCNEQGFEVVTGWGDVARQFAEGYFAATAPVLLLRHGEVVHDFGVRLSSERVGSLRPDGTPAGSGPHPFGRKTSVALGADRVYVGSGERYRVDVFDLEGTLVDSLVWAGPDLEVDEALLERLADEAVDAASEGSRPRLRRWYADLPRMDRLPAYDRILVSTTGQVWVRQFARPGDAGHAWVVFDGGGAPLGRLRMPEGATVWEVHDDRVVYSVLDELDVPVIRIARVRS